VYRVREGKSAVFVTLPEPPNGIVIDKRGFIWINSGASLENTEPNSIWRVLPDGSTERWVVIEEATFLNGMTLHPDGRILTVDSRSGGVYAIDPNERRWSVWFKSEDLKPEPAVRGPGANGIKLFGENAYVSVTNRAKVVRIKMDTRGEATTLNTFAEKMIVDDFAIDSDGNFYLATHPADTLVLMSADGKVRKTIAGPEQGMVGSTACMFAGERKQLYVTAEGGMLFPYQGKLQPAKLVCVDTCRAAELLEQ
jgi:sugar lactone lactonase YvrE